MGPVWKAKEVGQENVLRFSNKGDIVSIFNNSALKTTHPDPFSYVPSLWHDYHNEEQAGGRLGGELLENNITNFALPADAEDTKATIITE